MEETPPAATQPIARIDVFGYELRYAHGTYVMSGGRSAESQTSTLVRVTTVDGVEGWGETCPLGTTYLPAFAGGARAALDELAPALIGVDACNLAAVNAAMDRALLGHGYAKSPLDVACWDVLGKVTGMPVVTLLGGRVHESFPLYEAVPLGPAAEMAAYVEARKAAGIRHFQLKVGGDPREDARRVAAVLEATEDGDIVIADANGGWRFQDAVIAARLLASLPVYFEQPCPTMGECLRIRPLTALPMIYDECVTDVESFVRAVVDGGAGGINLKIGKVGGLTRARALRDLAAALGVSLTIEDTWGGDVTTATVAHLAASATALFTVSFYNDWTLDHVAGYEPRSSGGRGAAPDRPGLGIDVDVEALGAPLRSVSADG
jgi:L-alanine-DL-glutamate epimerase-like enolase superfamily enzyme